MNSYKLVEDSQWPRNLVKEDIAVVNKEAEKNILKASLHLLIQRVEKSLLVLIDESHEIVGYGCQGHPDLLM